MAGAGALDYYYGVESEQYTFYRIPKVLFTAPGFRQTSSDAKILYGLMLDRMGLSMRSGWLDEVGRVFIYFTLEEAMTAMGCGHTKAVALFTELDKAGLIERKKQGQGRPTKIYVKNFVRKAEVLTSEKRKSALPETGSQDFRKTDAINTDISNTEKSDTDPSIHPAQRPPVEKLPSAADGMDTICCWICSTPASAGRMMKTSNLPSICCLNDCRRSRPTILPSGNMSNSKWRRARP